MNCILFPFDYLLLLGGKVVVATQPVGLYTWQLPRLKEAMMHESPVHESPWHAAEQMEEKKSRKSFSPLPLPPPLPLPLPLPLQLPLPLPLCLASRSTMRQESRRKVVFRYMLRCRQEHSKSIPM